MMTARFQNIVETDNIAFNVSVGIVDRIAYTCLCGKVYYNIGAVGFKYIFNRTFIGKVALYKSEFFILVKDFKTAFLKRNFIVIVYIIKTDYLSTFFKNSF